MKKLRKSRRPLDEVRVHFSHRALELIAAECTNTEGETGGMLAGHIREAEGYIEHEVTHATPPGHDSRLSSLQFTRGSEFAKSRLDYLANKFGVGYLGEWHKHPVAETPRASKTDRQTMCAIARKPAYDVQIPVLVIANEDGRKLAIYAADRRRMLLIGERDVTFEADQMYS